MKLLIIRHADPDYEHDCLTPRGREEAAALAEYLKEKGISAIYASPLGRAKETAEFVAQARGERVEVLSWLREFPAKLRFWETEELEKSCPCPWATNFFDKARVVWDILPAHYTARENYFHKDAWRDTEIAAHSDMEACYEAATRDFDAFLRQHGYRREGGHYRAEKPNGDTIALVCHFGIECVLLSHLLGVSPFVLWQGFIAAPSAVTTVVTEEREEGIAVFRVTAFGDASHLAKKDMAPGFPGRYCEQFTDDTLH